MCLCLFVCVISNQSTSKNLHHVSDLSKVDTLLHKTCIKILRLNICTSMISLRKVANQMWRDHPFSQRNNTTEWAAVGLEATGKGVWTKFDKGVVNKRDLHKIVGGGGGWVVRTSLPTMITAFYMCSSFHFLYQYEKRFYFILLGININKALRMFHLMGLEMITQATYYRQYNLYVQPSVLLYWEKQQMHVLNQMGSNNAG